MKASEANLLGFLRKSQQFIIPIYQRTYSWTIEECQQLWDDILRAGKSDDVTAHFIGSIVYIEKGLYQVSGQSPLLVIDGQQRLTTISLLLEALARKNGEEEPVEGFSANKIRSYYLQNTPEAGEKRYKLLLTQTDKDSLISIIDNKPLPDAASLRIKENYEFFTEKIEKLGKNLEWMLKGLSKLIIVDVSLDRTQDNPQLIFESMNSTGRELSQADLIRNFVLMGLEPEQQNRIYFDHWRKMETTFGQEAYDRYFDSFMRHYLTVRTGELPNINKVYDAFKAHFRKSEKASLDVEDIIADMHAYADYFCAMALGKEKEKRLEVCFQDLRDLKVDVAYPLLLELYADYKLGLLALGEFEKILRWVESYVFRRAICTIPTNSLNKTFATFSKSIEKNNYLESVQAQFLLLPSYRRFPEDDEFEINMQIRDLYNFRSRSYWLRRMENFHRKEPVSLSEYTIEHIMPQNETLSNEWRQDLGEEWERVQNELLHTLGNLTLTGYNSEYSDRPFREKRDMTGGFKESPLRLNEGLGQLQTWNEEAIKIRAGKLAKKASTVWVAPSLSQSIMAGYRTPSARKDEYSIDDHPYLVHGSVEAGSKIPQLFQLLRQEILKLDPCVTEEFLKLYIAYKAETNFVDVVPQAKRLRLSLNMAFHEIDDPRGISKDVSNLGRWGNGDVEIGLETEEQLPYVMFLIRQSLEKQLGNGGAES